jgi:hypothetical protein
MTATSAVEFCGYYAAWTQSDDPGTNCASSRSRIRTHDTFEPREAAGRLLPDRLAAEGGSKLGQSRSGNGHPRLL